MDEPRRVHRGEALGSAAARSSASPTGILGDGARGEDPREIAAREVLEDDDQGAGELLDAVHGATRRARRRRAMRSYWCLKRATSAPSRSFRAQDLQQTGEINVARGTRNKLKRCVRSSRAYLSSTPPALLARPWKGGIQPVAISGGEIWH